jgi:hypothetical protein
MGANSIFQNDNQLLGRKRSAPTIAKSKVFEG